MLTIIAIVLIAHGIAHLPGFLVPWRLTRPADMPYKTTLLAGRVDVGNGGIRVVGALWLVAALAFVAAGIAALTGLLPWRMITTCAATFSLVLAILNYPEARIGIAINVTILLLLLLQVLGVIPIGNAI